MKIRYDLNEFCLLARSLPKHELENLLGKKFGIHETVKKPKIKIIVELKE